MTIVYEGSELVVHFNEGNSDYIVITFVGSWETENALSTFFAEKVISNNNITAFGITSKVDFWYISEETDDVINFLKEKTQTYKNIILIGLSMGGYPALVWSKKLNATTVFSMAPKYSLDPNECNVKEHYIERNFRSQMIGMSVKNKNIYGRVFIAYDPYDEYDSYHVDLIKKEIKDKNVFFVKTFFSGHIISLSLSGSKEFGYIINQLAYGSDNDVVKSIQKIRRKNRNNLINKFTKYKNNKSNLIFKALTGSSICENEKSVSILSDVDFIMDMIFSQLLNGYYQNASYLHNNFLENVALKKNKNNLVFQYLDNDFYLIDYHKRFISFNVNDYEMQPQKSLIDLKNSYPVLIDSLEKKLFIYMNQMKLFICEQDNKLYLSENCNDSTLSLEKISSGKEIFCIPTSGGFIVSKPDWSIDLQSKNKLEWESFFILNKSIKNTDVCLKNAEQKICVLNKMSSVDTCKKIIEKIFYSGSNFIFHKRCWMLFLKRNCS